MEFVFAAVAALLTIGVCLLSYWSVDRYKKATTSDNVTTEEDGAEVAANRIPATGKLPAMDLKRWIYLAACTLLIGAVGFVLPHRELHWLQIAKISATALALAAAMLIDVETLRIPNKLVLTYGAAILLVIALDCILHTKDILTILLTAGIGLGGCFLLFMLFVVITKGGIGLGDVKLIMVIGLAYGLFDALTIVLFGMIVCTVSAMVLLFTKKKKMKDELAFGPFIFLGYILMQFLQAI